MPAPSGSKPVASGPSSRVRELGLVLPAPPTPLGAYVESSDAGNLLFLSGTLPVVGGKLAISGRLGENLSVKQGQQAARIASLNALAVAKQHLGALDRHKAGQADGADGGDRAVCRPCGCRGRRVRSIRSNLWARGWARSFGLWSAKFAHWRASHSRCHI